jgi:HAD superfamily hydrolase (TIGR01509 family)
MIEAVVFDLDGLLIETEEIWDEVREEIVRERGERWTETAQRDMMGMSSTEWSRYMNEVLGVPDAPEQINELVVERMAERYRSSLPLLPGAVEAVQRIAARWPLGVASSSNRPLIALVLELSGLASQFQAVVSSEEVARGKPAPDVYLEAARRLGVNPSRAAAVEDSEAGIRSATAAGMRVVAIPNRSFPPSEAAVELADVVLASLDELTADVIEA